MEQVHDIIVHHGIIVHHFMLIIARIGFLVLGEGLTYGINGSFGLPEKKFSFNIFKTNKNFA